MLLNLLVQLLPLLVEVLPVFVVLFDSIYLFLLGVYLQGLVESQRINFLQNCLQSDQRLLQNFMPMVLSKVHDDGHQHGEGLLLVGLEDVKEVIILEEAHGSVGHLQVDSTNALHNPLEQFWDQVFYLVDLTNLQDLLELSQKESFLDAIGEGPVLEETF